MRAEMGVRGLPDRVVDEEPRHQGTKDSQLPSNEDDGVQTDDDGYCPLRLGCVEGL